MLAPIADTNPTADAFVSQAGAPSEPPLTEEAQARAALTTLMLVLCLTLLAALALAQIWLAPLL